MEWQDQGVLLNVRRHGENAAIIEVLTKNHGRHAGLVHGGASKKSAALLQAGTQLSLTWRARLEDQLGSFSAELLSSRSVALLTHKQNLYAFNALSAMFLRYLPEREPNPRLYSSVLSLLEAMVDGQEWHAGYCFLELQLLTELGYGLELSCCVVSGQTTDLAYISPKSGCAVSTKSARGFESRLLKFPDFLQSDNPTSISAKDFYNALLLTGHFFQKWIPTHTPELPKARQRLADFLQRQF
ncbi:MAG: DNA repair protein RecO [Rhodobacteraceae bacterium]|nr:DNA repair protein RecO [Paracoccaceae bacterium]